MDLIARKAQVQTVSSLYREVGYGRYAERMDECGRFAKFVEKEFCVPEFNEDGDLIDIIFERDLRLVSACFCRVRHCPICQWRKSARYKAFAKRDFPRLIAQFPDHRFLFLTLTVKNCPLEKLSKTVAHLNDSWIRLTEWKDFPALGWVKSLEVTLKDNGYCHPHFHVLLLVDSNYFDNENYWTQEDWCERWAKVAKLNYTPIVDIRAVKRGTEDKVIPELIKYTVKPKDLAEINKKDLLILTNQMHGVRAINRGGVLRNYFKKVGSDDIDLIGSKEDSAYPTGVQIRYTFDGANIYSWEYFQKDELLGFENVNIYDSYQEYYNKYLEDMEDE